MDDVLPLKISADASFKDKQYTEAIRQYLDCLSLFTAPNVECSPVVLLSNLAQCQLNQDDVHSAALSALVAVTLDPSHTKSVHRLAEALLRLELFDQAITLTAANNALFSTPGVKEKFLVGTGMTTLVDSRVPEFHIEFMRSGRLTTDCDVERCRQFVYNAYEVAKSIPMHEFDIVSKTVPFDINSEEFLKSFAGRFGGWSKKLVDWVTSAPFGDLNFDRTIGPYDRSILQSMSNSTNRPEKIYWGKTHVSIGFVDFGTLFHGILDGNESNDPLRWVGYEASAYCVAKTRVVAEMMRIGAEVKSVLQVSYSTGWSRKTKTQFREALTSLMMATKESEIAAYYRHWLMHDVSLSAAISKWIDTQTASPVAIANFKRKIDRLDLAHYYITGQLLDCEEGSVVMFANPHAREHLAYNSSFLHSVPDKDKLLGDKNKSIVQAAVDMLTEKIAHISRHVRAGDIEMSVRLGSVDLSAPHRLREISALKPSSISWSNVCDYFQPRDFHAVARRCSAPTKTVHHAYSMNWPYRVYGVQLYEYQVQCGIHDPSKIALKNVISLAKGYVTLQYNNMNLTNHMHSPPIDHIQNVTCHALGNAWHQKYVEAFFDFSEDQKNRLERASVGHVEWSPYSVLNRTRSD
eukprot:gene35759-44095_t